jgi:hypothetical protein
MIKTNKFERAIQLFDAANEGDPNKESFNGIIYPKELLYAQRMTNKLNSFEPDAEEALQLAVRCQHIQRWVIPREDYEMNRTGYLAWRNQLKKFHAERAAKILESVGYDQDVIDKVKFLLLKKKLKRDEMTQTLEDVVCLVFLEFYFEGFSEKYSEDKLIDILRKTWAKMSEKGRNAALDLKLGDRSSELVSKALA